MLHGYERRRQRELEGMRRISTQIYNLTASEPLTDAEFLPLPLIDSDVAEEPAESQESFFDRLRARGLTPVP